MELSKRKSKVFLEMLISLLKLNFSLSVNISVFCLPLLTSQQGLKCSTGSKYLSMWIRKISWTSLMYRCQGCFWYFSGVTWIIISVNQPHLNTKQSNSGMSLLWSLLLCHPFWFFSHSPLNQWDSTLFLDLEDTCWDVISVLSRRL